MATQWLIRPFDPDRVHALAVGTGISHLVAQLLINRGISDPDSARKFLDSKLIDLHDPSFLPGVEDAAGRIVSAVLNDKKIVIYGDYDVDGVCGTSLLWSCLKLAGAKHVDYYIPHRVEEGYGLSSEALTMLVRERGAELIITVDCGISAIPQALLARSLGVELIITDHHTIGPDLPQADVLVHPRLPRSKYPFGDLCGCGVAFKLAWQVCKGFGDGKKASPQMREFLLNSLTYVAMATVADVVPIADENRLLVKHGLAAMRGNKSHGLAALLRVSGLSAEKGISSGNVGFRLAPRINAAGRLERALDAVELLTTKDFSRAEELASKLDLCNTRRQEIERTIVAEAHAMIESSGGLGDRGAIVLGRAGWHPGVIGIVAGRVAEQYNRPTIIVALNEGISQGSARSVSGFNVYEALAACSEGLEAFGGHSAAAGIRLRGVAFDAFAGRFDIHCRGKLTPDLRQRVLMIDAEVPLAALSLKTVEDLGRMEPFGQGNPQPLIAVSHIQLLGPPKYVGQDGKTVQLRFRQGESVIKGVAFGQAERWRKCGDGAGLSVVGEPQINEFNGRRDVQIVVRDFKLESDGPVEEFEPLP